MHIGQKMKNISLRANELRHHYKTVETVKSGDGLSFAEYRNAPITQPILRKLVHKKIAENLKTNKFPAENANNFLRNFRRRIRI